MISESDLQQVMPKLPASERQLYLPFLNRTMEIYQIETPLRIAAYLAQIAHESGELRHLEEIWGPTPQQLRYDPPDPLAARLGNTEPGDGFKYRGRGPIQITGKFNYNKYGNLLGIDLVSNPELAATPQIAFSIAALYWQANGLNELADIEDFREITRRINGGYTGYEDRLKYYRIARQVLGIDSSFSIFAGIHSEDSSSNIDTVSGADPDSVTLPRGQELISAGNPARTTKKTAVKKSAKAAKATAKKATAKKAPAKKAPAKKAPARKAPAKKAPAKKAPAKKAPAKKAPAKKAPAKKAPAKKATARKATARKATAGKKK